MKTRKEFDIGKIDFIGKTSFFAWVSSVLMIGAIFLIFTKGFNYGIDFSGGTEVQVQFKNNIENIGEIRNFLTKMEMGSFQVQKFGEENEYLIRFETLLGETDQETNQLLQERISKVTEGLNTEFSQNEPVIRKVDSVGPQIGEQLKRNGLLAVFYSLLLIMIYIGLRFDYNFAPGAVVCLFHDSLVTLGIFVLLGKEINVQILAAILTIIGYSLNDTIIVFDRIRENLLKHKKGSLSQIINISVNEILSRTLVTSLTTLLAIGSLYFLAGGVIVDFAFAMGIGVLIGTYSSIYVASPLVIYFERFKSKQRATV